MHMLNVDEYQQIVLHYTLLPLHYTLLPLWLKREGCNFDWLC